MRRSAPPVVLAVLAATVAVWFATPDVQESLRTAPDEDGRVEPPPPRRHVAPPEVAPDAPDDENLDGVLERVIVVVDQSGAAVEGAEVTQFSYTDEVTHASATTDSGGRARLRLPASCEVIVRSAGRVTDTHGVNWLSTENPGELNRIVLRECRRVEGVVVDGAGRPLPRVIVRLVRLGPDESVTTDPAGRFVFDGVDPDPKIACYLDAILDGWVAPTTEVVPGELDVRVVMHRAGTVRGVVTFADGNAAAGARVEDEFADDAGRFEVRGVQPGSAVIEARIAAPGEKRVRLVGTAACDVPPGGVVDGLRIVLGPAEDRSYVRARVTGPDGQPVRRAFVFVYAEEAKPRSRSTDENGMAVVKVHAAPGTPVVVAAGGLPGSPRLDAMTPEPVKTEGGVPRRVVDLRLGEPGRLRLRLVDADGHDIAFETSHLSALFGELERNADGTFVLPALTQCMPSISVPGFARRTVIFDPPHARLREETIHLVRDERVTVTGRLIGEDGSVARESTVVVINVGRRDVEPGSEVWAGDSTTLSEGRFEFDGFLRGAATLRVLDPEDFAAVVFREFAVDGDTDLGDVLVPHRERFGGRIVDASGAPIAGAAILVQGGGERELSATTTRPDGTFDVLLAPGLPLRLTVSRRGYVERHVETTSGTDAPLRIVLEIR